MARPSAIWFRKDRDAWVCTIDGRRRTLARGKGNKAAAKREFHRLMARAGREEGPADAITLAELVGRFLVACRADGKAELTVEFYWRHLSAFLAAMGRDQPARTLRPKDVLDWLGTRTVARRDRATGAERRDPLSRSTRHGAVASIKRLYRWARKVGHLDADYMEGLDRPGIDRRERIMTPAAEAAAVAAARGPLRDHLEFMRETGCRPSEVARMRPEHCRLDRGVVVMPGKTTRKTNRDRVIYLNDPAREILARLVPEAGDGPVFRNSRGRPWTRNALALAMRRIRARAGLGDECVAESLRHSWITDAKLQLPNSAVAEMAGHTSTAMIDRNYGHLSERAEALLQAARSVKRCGPEEARDAGPVTGGPPA